jgi:hypothetical protein
MPRTVSRTDAVPQQNNNNVISMRTFGRVGEKKLLGVVSAGQSPHLQKKSLSPLYEHLSQAYSDAPSAIEQRS